MNTDTQELSCNFDPMEILKTEIPILNKIEQDECWYLGEKVNHYVEPKEVQYKIATILMKVGEELRVNAIKAIKKEKCINNCEICKFKNKGK